MKLIVRLIIIGALTYFLSPFATWWFGMIVAFVVCYASPSSGLNAFVAGFLGVGLVWMGHAWNIDVQNESAFSNTVAEIMQIGDPILLVFATGLIGGLAGGFASLSGTTFRQLFIKPKKRSLYS
ncbi:hypothetical protein [Ekhidna sp. To15]|uniref:hypothetical protein n=1 Tax=Ekhidna sp. To15 TaxID=3395267 RepID=UPI003F527BF0